MLIEAARVAGVPSLGGGRRITLGGRLRSRGPWPGEIAAQSLLQRASLRYHKGGIILTGSRSFGELGDIFTDHVLAVASLLGNGGIPPLSGVYPLPSQGFPLWRNRQVLCYTAW